MSLDKDCHEFEVTSDLVSSLLGRVWREFVRSYTHNFTSNSCPLLGGCCCNQKLGPCRRGVQGVAAAPGGNIEKGAKLVVLIYYFNFFFVL
jgi:hypothetical protein